MILLVIRIPLMWKLRYEVLLFFPAIGKDFQLKIPENLALLPGLRNIGKCGGKVVCERSPAST
jgi:hypothetical protein